MPAKNTPPSSKAAATPLKVLTEENAGALHPEDSVQTAGLRMRDHDTSKWPVAQDHKLVGMIDQKDPDWKIGGRGHDPKTGKVSQIMSKDLTFCYEDEDCASAQRLMDERGLNYLPVVDRQMHIVGIFSRAEIQAKAQALDANAATTQA